MYFGEYLRLCREGYHLTQEALVQELYAFDDTFKSLECSALSRWERNVVQPSIQRQLKLIHYFQKYSDRIFPCIEGIDYQEVENNLCLVGIKNLLGKSNQHIMKFPSKSFEIDDIQITQLDKESSKKNEHLPMVYSTLVNLTENGFGIEKEHLESWLSHPSSLFIIAEYHNQFFGMLFSLRLKPEVFDKVMNFKKEISTLACLDFATFDEAGSILPFAFFAYNEMTAELLFLRYYAHLIARQGCKEIGAVALLEGGKKIATQMQLELFKEQTRVQGTFSSYRSSMLDALLNEAVLKMCFQK